MFYILPRIAIAFCFWWILYNGVKYWKDHRDGVDKHKVILKWYFAFFLFAGLTRITEIFGVRDTTPFNLIIINLAAIFSLKAAQYTRPFVMDMIKLPSRKELHDAVDKHAKEKMKNELLILEKNLLIKSQTQKILNLTEMIETQVWIADKEKTLAILKDMLKGIQD